MLWVHGINFFWCMNWNLWTAPLILNTLVLHKIKKKTRGGKESRFFFWDLVEPTLWNGGNFSLLNINVFWVQVINRSAATYSACLHQCLTQKFGPRKNSRRQNKFRLGKELASILSQGVLIHLSFCPGGDLFILNGASIKTPPWFEVPARSKLPQRSAIKIRLGANFKRPPVDEVMF